MKIKITLVQALSDFFIMFALILVAPLLGQNTRSDINDSYIQTLQQSVSKIKSLQLTALIVSQIDPPIAAQANADATVTRSVTYIGDSEGRYFYDITYLNDITMETKGYTTAYNGKLGQFLLKEQKPLLSLSKKDFGGSAMLTGANPLFEPLDFLCADCNGDDPKMQKTNNLSLILDVNNLLKRLSSAKILEDHHSWYFSGGLFNGGSCDFIVHFDPRHAFPVEVERVDPKTKQKFTDWTVSEWGTITNGGSTFEYPKSAHEKIFDSDGKLGAITTMTVESLRFNEPVRDDQFIISLSHATRIYDADSHLYLNK